MNKYVAFLYLVSTNGPCTRFYLEHLDRGRYKERIDECIALGYIHTNQQNVAGQDLYSITDSGRKIVDDPGRENV